jgi:hypothetical protein
MFELNKKKKYYGLIHKTYGLVSMLVYDLNEKKPSVSHFVNNDWGEPIEDNIRNYKILELTLKIKGVTKNEKENILQNLYKK